jgi:hypothetical protein
LKRENNWKIRKCLSIPKKIHSKGKIKMSSQVMCKVDIENLLNGTSNYINEFNV